MEKHSEAAQINPPTVRLTKMFPARPIVAAMARAQRLADDTAAARLMDDAAESVADGASTDAARIQVVDSENLSHGKRKRSLQHVVSKQQKAKVVKWMLNQ